MRKLALLSILSLVSWLPLRAQSFDASQWSEGVTTIHALWRFHTGDDPRWASPSFDDSSWPLLTTNAFWSAQGYRGYYGFAWYRLRIKLPATTQPLGINIGHINSAAEVYAGGELLGANGIMRPKPDWSSQIEANAFPIPISLNGRWVEIAVRVWKSPVASSYSGGGFHEQPVVGSLALLQAGRRIALDNGLAGNFSLLTLDLFLLAAGCVGLGLFLLNRRNIEYAWFAVWAIGSALLDIWTVSGELREGSVTLLYGYGGLFRLPIYFCSLLFIWGFLKAPRRWLFWTAVSFDVVEAAGNLLGFENAIPLPDGQAILTGCIAVIFGLIVARLALSLKEGNRDAKLLIVPMSLMGLGIFIDEFRGIFFFAGWSHNREPLILWTNSIVAIYWTDFFQFLNLITISFAILLRFTRAAQEEKRLATELEAAREVQSRLVPERLPALGSLRLQAAYLPAAEVGGDFYQVFPYADGSALIVIGDVSGKGLKAAMSGTLALGALRALAQQEPAPAKILERLNTQLTDSQGGFVTCLCALVACDGSVIMANAGHLAPYLAGEEIACESGLPLGIAAGATYAESTLTLAPGDTLTFLSDGVVEAQSASGELFGFERTRSISTQSAEEIARAAQAHGQHDDITVLTLAFTPAEVVHA